MLHLRKCRCRRHVYQHTCGPRPSMSPRGATPVIAYMLGRFPLASPTCTFGLMPLMAITVYFTTIYLNACLRGRVDVPQRKIWALSICNYRPNGGGGGELSFCRWVGTTLYSFVLELVSNLKYSSFKLIVYL